MNDGTEVFLEVYGRQKLMVQTECHLAKCSRTYEAATGNERRPTALRGNPISELGDVTLPCGITQCYLSPDTSERAPPNHSHAGWYSINLPRRDGRLS